jgi:hypothetical protein
MEFTGGLAQLCNMGILDAENRGDAVVRVRTATANVARQTGMKKKSKYLALLVTTNIHTNTHSPTVSLLCFLGH